MVLRFDYRQLDGSTLPFVSCIEQILRSDPYIHAWPMNSGGMNLEREYMLRMLAALSCTDADYLRRLAASWS
jgi:hypothetical protein